METELEPWTDLAAASEDTVQRASRFAAGQNTPFQPTGR